MSDENLQSSKDFEIDAFDTLDNAPDYNTGVNTLVEKYSSSKFDNPEDAKRVLAEYTDSLRYKFKGPVLDDESLLTALPFTPEEAASKFEDPVDAINYWEEENTNRINNFTDPDQIAGSNLLKNQTREYASRARRDVLGNRGDGALSWAADKFYRATEGLAGPLANSFVGRAIGIDGVDQALIERTQPSRDKDVSSKIASIVGGIAPIVATSLVPGGQGVSASLATGVIGLQTEGQMHEMYKQSLEATGDPLKATEAAAYVGAANAIGMLPAGKIVTGTGAAIKQAIAGSIKKDIVDETVARTLINALQANKKSVAGIAADALGMGGAGAASGVVARHGQNIGFDTNQSLTDDVVNDFLATAAVGGAFSAAHAVVENAYLNVLQDKFKSLDADLIKEKQAQAEEAVKTGKKIKPTKEYFARDEHGYNRPLPEEESTVDTRQRVSEEYEQAQSDYINEKYNDEPGVVKNELGEAVDVPQQPDVEISLAPKEEPSPAWLETSAKLGEAESAIKNWSPETSAKAHKALALQKEADFISKRIENLQAKKGAGEEAKSGPSYDEQLSKYKSDLDELNKELSKPDSGAKEARILQQRKEASDTIKKFKPEEKITRKNTSPEAQQVLAGKGILGTANPPMGSSGAAILLAKYITGGLKLSRNILDGAYGAYYPGTGVIKILRSLGANPDSFYSTLAHEVGHAVRFYMEDFANGGGAQSKVLQDFIRDWGEVRNLLTSSWDAIEFRLDLEKASKEWRPGWDDDASSAYSTYRADPEESFADAFSYLVNAPQKFKERFPELYKKFETTLAENTHLNEFWDTLNKISLDPREAEKFNSEIQRSARRKMAEKASEAILQKQAESTVQSSLKKHLESTYQYVFNKYSVAKKLLKSWPDKVRNVGYDIFNNLARGGAIRDRINRTMEVPLKSLLAKFKQTGIDENDWAQYEAANKLLNDTTLTMARIKEDPAKYTEAAKLIKSLLLKEKGVSIRDAAKNGVEDIFDFSKISTPEELTDALAKIAFIGDTAHILSLKDFEARQDPALPPSVRRNNALVALNRARARLETRKVSIPVENIRKRIEDMRVTEQYPQEILDAALDVLSPNAFAARKYLMNPFGRTKYDAEAELSFMKDRLGADKFKTLQDVSREFHQIMNSVMPDVIESGIFTPDMIARFKLNSDNYVTNAVLKYFEGNDSIDSSVRSAIGSLDETGNELAATNMKMQAVLERAYRQRAINSAIEIARRHADLLSKSEGTSLEKSLKKAGDITFEKVSHSRPGYDIFGERDRLSKTDNKHSYLIGYKEGQATLYKIGGGKGFEKMFNTVRSLPGLEPVLYMSDQLSKLLLVRQFKTTLSPGFTLFQKFYDRKLEALLANSFEVTFGLPIHTGKELRAIDSQTLQEISHYKKTGELTGNLKKVVDLDGAALDEAMFAKEGIDSRTSATNALYEMFGDVMPEEGTVLEKAGVWADEKLRNTVGKFWDAIGLGPDMAVRDELRTKINGFAIGKAHGMSDAEAAVFARERFGIPDPTGGGIASPLINRMFLFGRAHLNGLRVLGSFLADTPKIASTQIAYRVLMPKLLMLPAVMVPVIRAVLGKEEGDKYDLFLRTVGRMEKISKNLIPLGWQDGQGNYHNFLDVKLSQIQSDWKPWYIRLPQSREITSLTKVFFPFIENMFDPGKALTQSAQGVQSEFTGNIQPAIQYMSNMMAIIMGKNPEDFYRMKPVFSEDLQNSGSLAEKAGAYAQYLGAAHFPAGIPYNPFTTTTEPKSTGEKIMQRVPFAGPMLRSLVGTSTYGQIENSKEEQAHRQEIQAGIRRSVSDESQIILNSYKQAASKVSSLGKGWEKKVGPDVAKQIHYLLSWHAKVWVPYEQELEAALAKNDTQRYEYLLRSLNGANSRSLSKVRSYASTVKD